MSVTSGFKMFQVFFCSNLVSESLSLCASLVRPLLHELGKQFRVHGFEASSDRRPFRPPTRVPRQPATRSCAPESQSSPLSYWKTPRELIFWRGCSVAKARPGGKTRQNFFWKSKKPRWHTYPFKFTRNLCKLENNILISFSRMNCTLANESKHLQRHR